MRGRRVAARDHSLAEGRRLWFDPGLKKIRKFSISTGKESGAGQSISGEGLAPLSWGVGRMETINKWLDIGLLFFGGAIFGYLLAMVDEARERRRKH